MSTSPTTTSQPAGENLFDGYHPPAAAYDEMLTSDGQLRPHWQPFIASLNELGREEFARRSQLAQRLIHTNGIAYSAVDSKVQRSRPWELDALPLLLSADAWKKISNGICQRAHLLNLVLKDLYGEQTLLRRKIIPPELLFGNPGFMPGYHGQKLANNCYLHLFAADLARSPDGHWWVTADRTEAPSGTGYALENRIVASRMLPNVIPHMRVERLAPFFITLQETLWNLAPAHRDNPRVVLLSPGPTSPTYFEDAYLARYLGYTLVEGGDLTVRNEHVFLKTLGGLLSVDVILRRLHDEDCDPLELRSNSPLGVPGLLQAARVGNVTIANSIGSGIVETPAFMAYLPALCQALLGERLQLPNVATWWCGDPASRKYVLQNLNRLVVKPAFRRGWQEDIIGNQISQQSRDRLKQLIESRPMEFVGQEFVSRSVTPVWGGDQALPWHVALRTYGVATGESYTAMMGGLTRASFSSGLLDLRISSGERSKDCWIVSNRPVRPVSLLKPAGSPVELRRSGSELPSRVADNLYWLGRNVERAEGAARLVRTILIRLTGESDVLSIPELPILLRGLASQGQIEAGFAVQGLREQLPSIVNAIPLAIFDESEPRSLHATVTAMHRTASIVRDRISIDSWRIINKIVQDLSPQGGSKRMDVGEALSRIDQMIIDLAAFTGMAMDSMTRNEIWWFLDIGRRIERALHTISLLQDSLVESLPQPAPVLQAVLEAADSSMTYRSRYLANLQVAPVLDLLLTDETNPRSVVFQFVALNEHISHLPRNPNRAQRGEDERLVMSALNSIRMVDIEHLCVARDGGNRKALDSLLSKLSQRLPKLSEAISHRYLIHAGQSHQLAEIRPSQER